MIDFDILNASVRDVFGETVTIRREGVPDVEVQAIYDSRYYATEGGEVNGSDLLTSVTIRSEDAGVVNADDIVIARGVTYRVWEPRPDGQGMTTLPLERV